MVRDVGCPRGAHATTLARAEHYCLRRLRPKLTMRMMLNKRNSLILALLPVLGVFLGLAGFMYYQKVCLPAHDYVRIVPLNVSPEEARVKWMEIVANRNGTKEIFEH